MNNIDIKIKLLDDLEYTDLNNVKDCHFRKLDRETKIKLINILENQDKNLTDDQIKEDVISKLSI